MSKGPAIVTPGGSSYTLPASVVFTSVTTGLLTVSSYIKLTGNFASLKIFPPYSSSDEGTPNTGGDAGLYYETNSGTLKFSVDGVTWLTIFAA